MPKAKVNPITKNDLTHKQEKFCQLFASDKEFFGNGVQSYIEAYEVDLTKKGSYDMARAGACENLTKPHILKRIDELIEFNGLNDSFVDKQLFKVIQQDAEYSPKIAAIREYNKLKARITEKIDHTSGGKPLQGILHVLDNNSNPEDSKDV